MAQSPTITAAQTVGPFFGYALPFPGGPDAAAAGDPGAVLVHGYVYDGAGAPVPDGLLEFWQAAPDGSLTGAPGTLRRDPTAGAVLGRDHVRFTGFTRVPTDADGHYAIRTLIPPPIGHCAPSLAVCVFARGLLHHLFTRVYFAEDSEAHAGDPLLSTLTPARRTTLIARTERERVHRFDIRIQEGGDGGDETVFLDFGA
jgi:protocatechuate 3,4-dioxygenase alpha subunit